MLTAVDTITCHSMNKTVMEAVNAIEECGRQSSCFYRAAAENAAA